MYPVDITESIESEIYQNYNVIFVSKIFFLKKTYKTQKKL